MKMTLFDPQPELTSLHGSLKRDQFPSEALTKYYQFAFTNLCCMSPLSDLLQPTSISFTYILLPPFPHLLQFPDYLSISFEIFPAPPPAYLLPPPSTTHWSVPGLLDL